MASRCPLVSALLVTWNSRGEVEDCLESLFSRTREPLEVIVVDNASTDNTVAAIRAKFPHIRVLELRANLGFAPAMNFAQGLAAGEYLFWLNPDARLETDVVGELVSFLEEHPEAGAAGPMLLDSGGMRAPFSARRFPTLANASVRLFGLAAIFQRRRSAAVDVYSISPGEGIVQIECLQGAAVMVRRDVAVALERLDERLPMYFEDMDYCARIWKAGWSISYLTASRVRHHGARSASASPARRLLLQMENGEAPWLFFCVHRGRWQASVYRLLALVSSLTRICVAAPWRLLRRPDPHCLAVWQRALALLSWSLTPGSVFRRRVANHFGRGERGLRAIAGTTAPSEAETA